MVKKAYQNPKGGLNDAGRKHFKVKAPVKAGDNPRRASFLGEPTRLLLSLRAWGASSKADARAKARAISRRNKA